MENKEQISHLELEVFLGEIEAAKIIKEANGRLIFIEYDMDFADKYTITYH
jgi:hypothetical protein